MSESILWGDFSRAYRATGESSDAEIGHCARENSGEMSILSTAPDSRISAPDLGTKTLRTGGAHASGPVLGVLTALSFSHLLNDAMQSLIPAIYPILKSALHLDFFHVGLISLTNQLAA